MTVLERWKKKMWSIFGALSIISVINCPIGQRILTSLVAVLQYRTTKNIRNEWI